MNSTKTPHACSTSHGTLCRNLLLLGIASFVVSASAKAESISYGFYGITENAGANTQTGESQLSVAVSESELNSDLICFKFTNVGPKSSSITDIYFDDEALGMFSGIDSILEGDGVQFSAGATPGNLPGGDGVNSFTTSLGLSADSDPPVQINGVNPGEWIELLLTLSSSASLSQVADALSNSSLRIGLRVNGFAEGGAESFINETSGVSPVPAPEPAGILCLGLVTAAWFYRRKRCQSARSSDPETP